MINKINLQTDFLFLLFVFVSLNLGYGNPCAESKLKDEPNHVDTILGKLSERSKTLRTYQAGIEYTFSQPLFDSQTVRTGRIYYKQRENRSWLRFNFDTVQQDEGDVQKQRDQWIFDGIWLTHIDYQTKHVKQYQQAEPNEPINAFDLASQHFPILGFTQAKELKKQFEIKLIGQDANSYHLNLKVRPTSVYKDDYSEIDFWIDKTNFFPMKIVTHSTEQDIYHIQFISPEINEKIDQQVFKLRVPAGFDRQIEPLKDK